MKNVAKNTEPKKEKTCKERIAEHYKSRMSTLRSFQALGWSEEYSEDECSNFYEFGLSFSYIEPGTYEGQKEGYFCYLLSWGGPSDEFRFYAQPGKNEYSWKLYKIEYRFMDWFDGACRNVKSGKDWDLLCDLFENFNECGTVQHAFNQAMKE